ncbi:MAG TPA: hypothetical protein DCW90_15910 [Lachnospiraceae bacterium]|nr:hypothetical protein [Lachnospiraceae bacterium]
MAENKYSITIRSVCEGEDNLDKLQVQWYDGLSANEVSQWIIQVIREFEVSFDDSDPLGVTIEEVKESFNALVEAINSLEKAHIFHSVTYEILDFFITVQVIYGDESE